MRGGARLWIIAGAASGFIGVAAGAFGAHGLKDTRAIEVMRTGAAYELTHAVAILVCGALMRSGFVRVALAPALFLAGTALFSGSLYALALGAPRWVGFVTPFGGVAFLAGWAALAWAAARDR